MFCLDPGQRVPIGPERAFVRGSRRDVVACRPSSQTVSGRPGSGDRTANPDNAGDVCKDEESIGLRRQVPIDARLIFGQIPGRNHIRPGSPETKPGLVHKHRRQRRHEPGRDHYWPVEILVAPRAG